MKLHTRAIPLRVENFDADKHAHEWGDLCNMFEIPNSETTFNPSHTTVQDAHGGFTHVVSWAEATTPEEIEELKQQRQAMRAARSGLALGPRT